MSSAKIEKLMKIFNGDKPYFRILKFIKENKQSTIQYISKNTGFSIPKTTVIVNDLHKKFNLAEPAGSIKIKKGRHPQLFQLNHKLGYMVGIDIGSENIRIVITDFKGNIIANCSDKTTVEDSDNLLNKIFNKIDDLILISNVDKNKIKGIGIGISGTVDIERGILLISSNLNWLDLDIKDKFENKFKIPVFVDTSERAMAYAEKIFGVAIDYKDFLYIAIGKGIGSSLYINDNLYRGSSGYGGEFGHIIVKENGLPCRCGNHGCLETIVSSKGIINRAKELIISGVGTSINKKIRNNLNNLSLEIINIEAINGDKVAFKLIQDSGEILGQAISSIINVLGINVVIIGGGLGRNGNIFIDSIKNSVKEKTISSISKNLNLLKTSLDENSGAIGAALFVIDKLFYSKEIIKYVDILNN